MFVFCTVHNASGLLFTAKGARLAAKRGIDSPSEDEDSDDTTDELNASRSEGQERETGDHEDGDAKMDEWLTSAGKKITQNEELANFGMKKWPRWLSKPSAQLTKETKATNGNRIRVS